MLRASKYDVSIVRKRILQVSSVMGLALFVWQAQVCFAQDTPPPPTTTAPTPVPAPVTGTPPAPAVVVPKQANSVAVLDLGVKQEYQDFFYDEKQSAKSSYKKTKRSGVDTQNADTSDRTGMSDVDSQSDSSYSKQYGYKTRVSYKEIRGLMVEIRTALKQAGYTVILPQGLFAKKMETGELPSIKERLATGDLGGAQYVMIPNVVDASVRETKETIQGTSDYASRFEMNLTVEFTMVNTDTQAVIASFNASGSGADAYLGKENVRHIPDIARVKRDMLTSFGADARKKLTEQLPKAGAIESFEQKPGTSAESFGDGDPKTLKVYRVTESEKSTDKDGASSEKRKEEIRVYRK